MTIENKLRQMGNGLKAEVQVYKFYFSELWQVMAKGENDSMKFEVKGEADNFPEALEECHRRWLQFAVRMPELMNALPAPISEDAYDGDSMVQPPVNDDTPLLMPRNRAVESVDLIETYPDGSRLLGQMQYKMNPAEGWVYNTWIEGVPEDEVHQTDNVHQERLSTTKANRNP